MTRSGETNPNGDKESRYVIETETIEYLRNVEKFLDENNFQDPKEKEILITNAFNEIDGTEIRLMSHNTCSEILEKMIQQSSLLHVASFPSKFQGQYWHLAKKRFASHVIQTALLVSSRYIHQEQLELKNSSFVEDKSRHPIVSVVLSFASELEANIADGIRDTYASHVFRSLFILLSGKASLDEQYVRSDSSKHFKSHHNLNQKHDAENLIVPSELSESFHSLLQAVLMDSQQLEDFAFDPIASPTLQVLLLCCNGREKELFMENLLGNRNEQERKSFILHLSQDKIGSHFLQAIIKVISPSTLKKCYESCFKNNINQLLGCPSSLNVLQDLVSFINEKGMLEKVIEELISNVDTLRNRNCILIVVKVVAKCAELQKCFKKIMKLIQCFFGFNDSSAVSDIQNLVQKPDLNISLIIQSIFTFPSKYSQPYLDAFLQLSSQVLVILATNCVCSHMIEAFFKGTSSKEQKQMLVDKFNGTFHKLASDKYASHLVQTVWALLPIDYKISIAKELLLHKKYVEDSKYGNIIMHEFRIEKYSRKPEEWEKELKTVDKKQKMLQEFLNE